MNPVHFASPPGSTHSTHYSRSSMSPTPRLPRERKDKLATMPKFASKAAHTVPAKNYPIKKGANEKTAIQKKIMSRSKIEKSTLIEILSIKKYLKIQHNLLLSLLREGNNSLIKPANTDSKKESDLIKTPCKPKYKKPPPCVQEEKKLKKSKYKDKPTGSKYPAFNSRQSFAKGKDEALPSSHKKSEELKNAESRISELEKLISEKNNKHPHGIKKRKKLTDDKPTFISMVGSFLNFLKEATYMVIEIIVPILTLIKSIKDMQKQ
ncbi:MAG: hypothetical protein PUP46_07215 [Endozoicomonas sp. (ex Botrylloides leachii)]|nr:hypothetical protein [Endozoicomonas sp. (ex Botrylloides leachii)]